MNAPGSNSVQMKCAAETAAPQWLGARFVVQASGLHMPAFGRHYCRCTSWGER